MSTALDLLSGKNQAFSFQLAYEFNSVNRLVSDNQALENDPRIRNGSNINFKADYSLNEHWSFSASLPYVIQNRQTISQRESSIGVGDLSLLAQYSFDPFSKINVGFTAGLKLPTGETLNFDDRAIVLSPDMQSGSGSLDYLFRLTFTSFDFIWKNLNLQSAYSYRINTTNDHFGDPTGQAGRRFKFGNELLSRYTISYPFLVDTWFIYPDIALEYRTTNANIEQGVEAPNSGGTWINLPLGVRFEPNEKFNFRISALVPIYQNLDGLQITTDYRLGIQFNYQISLQKDQNIELINDDLFKKL